MRQDSRLARNAWGALALAAWAAGALAAAASDASPASVWEAFSAGKATVEPASAAAPTPAAPSPAAPSPAAQAPAPEDVWAAWSVGAARVAQTEAPPASPPQEPGAAARDVPRLAAPKNQKVRLLRPSEGSAAEPAAAPALPAAPGVEFVEDSAPPAAIRSAETPAETPKPKRAAELNAAIPVPFAICAGHMALVTLRFDLNTGKVEGEFESMPGWQPIQVDGKEQAFWIAGELKGAIDDAMGRFRVQVAGGNVWVGDTREPNTHPTIRLTERDGLAGQIDPLDSSISFEHTPGRYLCLRP